MILTTKEISEILHSIFGEVIDCKINIKTKFAYLPIPAQKRSTGINGVVWLERYACLMISIPYYDNGKYHTIYNYIK